MTKVGDKEAVGVVVLICALYGHVLLPLNFNGVVIGNRTLVRTGLRRSPCHRCPIGLLKDGGMPARFGHGTLEDVFLELYAAPGTDGRHGAPNEPERPLS